MASKTETRRNIAIEPDKTQRRKISITVHENLVDPDDDTIKTSEVKQFDHFKPSPHGIKNFLRPLHLHRVQTVIKIHDTIT